MTEIKFSALAGMFGMLSDKFVPPGEYKPPKTTEQIIKDAEKVPGLKGIELVERDHITSENAHKVAQLTKDAGLEIAAIFPNLWAGKFVSGGFSSVDEKIRKEAVLKVKTTMDFAKNIGCNHLKIWYGQDGYDYCFQTNYPKAWDRMVDGMRECAEYRPEVELAINWKIKDPRTHMFIGTVGKMILFINEIGRENVGVDIDLSHTFLAYENLAESASLLNRFGIKIFHVSFGDNYRLWDDMMIPCSVHTIEILEFLYWLKKIGYGGWHCVDVYTFRVDGVAAAIEGIEWIKSLYRVLERIEESEIEKVIEKSDATGALKLLRKALF